MKTLKQKTALGLLCAGLALSALSARPTDYKTQPLARTAEVQAVGGSRCTAALGIGAGLAIAALSPCSILCAVGAWYIGIGGAAVFC